MNDAAAGHGETGTAATWTMVFVDDDLDFLAAQEAFFGSRGHKVVTVDTSSEALEMLETLTPDIIFLDLMMEHFDSGFQLCHKLRQLPKLAEVPIVMLSGVAAATGQRFDDEQIGLKSWSKIDGFVDKPVTSKQLLKEVQDRLGEQA